MSRAFNGNNGDESANESINESGEDEEITHLNALVLPIKNKQLDNLGPVYMIPPRRDGTFLSRLDGKLAKAGWRVYMNKYIAGMKPFKC